MLKQPSTCKTIRKKRLQTFSVKKGQTRKVRKLEKDRKLLIDAMKKRLEFSRKTGSPINTVGEQLLELPLAICDSDGKLLKGQKSSITKMYENRYKSTTPPVFSEELPWAPQSVVIRRYDHYQQPTTWLS